MVIIVSCYVIGRKIPTLGGLLATAPITSLIVLLWLYSDKPGDFGLMKEYTKGVLWGIIPTVFFFLVVFMCFHKRLNIWTTLTAGTFVWLAAAIAHQWLLNR